MPAEDSYCQGNEKGSEIVSLARIFYELVSRDRGEGCATGQPQGIGSEAYLNSTSQGPIPEETRKDVHIRGRSHAGA
jgi:hypothetical protein